MRELIERLDKMLEARTTAAASTQREKTLKELAARLRATQDDLDAVRAGVLEVVRSLEAEGTRSARIDTIGNKLKEMSLRLGTVRKDLLAQATQEAAAAQMLGPDSAAVAAFYGRGN